MQTECKHSANGGAVKLTPQNLMRVGKSAGLLEPKTKSKKLRLCLPALEAFLATGASHTACREYLDSLGISFPNDAQFRHALFRARKSGSLLPAEHWVGLSGPGIAAPASDASGTPVRLPELPPTNETRTVGANGSTVLTLKQHGTTFIRVERKDELTNKQPRMEDFL